MKATEADLVDAGRHEGVPLVHGRIVDAGQDRYPKHMREGVAVAVASGRTYADVGRDMGLPTSTVRGNVVCYVVDALREDGMSDMVFGVGAPRFGSGRWDVKAMVRKILAAKGKHMVVK